MKMNGCQLCFAKKVAEGDYNVIWNSSADYLLENDFSSMPVCQIFGALMYQDGATVQISENPVTIAVGQIVTLDQNGVISPPSTGNSTNSISLLNHFGSTNIRLNELFTGTGQQQNNPIYVTQNPCGIGEMSLTPVQKVLVWFEQNTKPNSMFSGSRYNSLEINLTHSGSATVLFENQNWSRIS